MASISKTLRVLADPNRLRILLLLKDEELSVAELQEILAMGQSTISTHLSQLKLAEFVEDRRTGKSNLYRLASQPTEKTGVLKGHDVSRASNGQSLSGALAAEGSFLANLLARAAAELPEASADQGAMRRVLKKRQDRTRAFFDSVAGRLGKDYVPGKSWKSLAEALLRLIPPMVVADLGAGEGSSALLLSQRAVRVIAVDSSAKMIEVGRELAARHGIGNIDYRLGDMEEIPITDGEAEVAFFSQSLHHALHPERAIREAYRILAPGGRIVVLDLLKHRFEEARDMYADEWLGFSETELESMLQNAGFANVETAVVDKELEAMQFQTLLGIADKPE
jgi:ubiquinone/menaquinone biosynthesis C-methylase UbiE/DNA-binding transcriptional ArsR family regulator